jgi:hypothetical protein
VTAAKAARAQARAARRRARAGLTTAAAVTALVAGTAAVAGCAASGSAAAKPSSAGNVFTTARQVSLQQVRNDISALYSDHPGIAAFDVQDVQYTPGSRDAVLRQCTTGGSSASSQDAETGQIIACAPLIFFFYSYGRQASVPAAVTVAGDIYWYAVTHITGPLSARTSLDELLQSWKLPVQGLTPAQQRTAVAASVIIAAGDAMLTQKSVRVVITDRAAGAASSQRIVADIGAVTGTELITYGTTTATILVTRQAAYFTGNAAGLSAYLGLSAASAAKVGSRWVVIKAGTSEYQDLAAEDTISSLPSSILPSAADATGVRAATIDGQKAYILDWTATAGAPAAGTSASNGTGAAVSVRLTLTAGPQVLPVSETITTSTDSKTVTFSRWGAPFTVTAPARVIPYAQLKS